MEAVEEGTGVDRLRLLQLALVEQALEGLHVARHPRGIEPEIVAGGDDRVLAERGPDHVQRVGQEGTGALDVRLGPEERDQLVARDQSASSHGEDGEEGESPSTRSTRR